MALEDYGGGSDLAPSEPAQQLLPPLPVPPIDMSKFNFGGLIGGLGGLLGQAPQNLGQATQASWDQTTAPAQSAINTVTPFIDNTVSPLAQQYWNNWSQQNQQNYQKYGLVGGIAMSSPLTKPTEDIISQGGNAADTELQRLASATQPPPGQQSDKDEQMAHLGATLLQGPAHLAEQAPDIGGQLFDSFREGLSTTTSSDPNAESRNRQAGQELLNTMGQVTNDIFDPNVMHTAIRDSMMSNGASQGDANKAANYLAGPISMIASFASPGPAGKMMLAQFVGNVISNPGAALSQLTNMSPSPDLAAQDQQIQADIGRANRGELSQQELNDLQNRINAYNQAANDPAQQQSTGDFTHLFQKTWAWMNGKDSAPSPDEVNKGLNALSFDVGILHGGLHGAKDSAASLNQTRIAFERGLTGQDPSGAREIAQSGTANLGQAGQAGTTDQTSQSGQAPPAGAASAPQTPGGTSEGSRQAIANLTPAVQNQRGQGEGLPQANAQPVPPVLRPDLGTNRPTELSGYTISGQGMNDDGVALANHTANVLRSAGLGDAVTNLHFVHNPDVHFAGAFDPDIPRNIEINSFDATKPQDYKEFLDDAQKFVSSTKPEDLTEPYRNAVDQALQFVHNAMFASQGDNMAEVAAHEALHAETWARTAGQIGDTGVLDNVPSGYRTVAEMSLSLFNSLKNSGVGQRWLAHDSTQAAIGKDLAAIEDFQRTGKVPVFEEGSNKHGYLNDPFSHLLEHFNYALQWAKGLSRHPYSLQAGDDAYAETFYNRQRAEEANQLALQWFDATRNDAVAAIQSGSKLYPSTPGGSLYRGASDRTGGQAGSNQGGLKPEKPNSFEVGGLHYFKGVDGTWKMRALDATSGDAGPVNMKRVDEAWQRALGEQGGQHLLPDSLEGRANPFNPPPQPTGRLRPGTDPRTGEWSPVRALLEMRDPANKGPITPDEARRIQGFDSVSPEYLRTVLTAANEHIASQPKLSQIVDKVNQTIGNTSPQTKPGVVPEGTKPTPPDWRKFASEVAGSDEKHPFADLRGIGLAAKAAFDKVDAAIEGVRLGQVSPEDLHKAATDLGFEVARIRGAWELRTSSAVSKIADKEHPDWKQTKSVVRQIERSTASPNEKAAMAALKLGMTLEEARTKMKDAVFGMDATATNWHPDYKNMLMGELGRVAKDLKVGDGKPILGMHNIPMHEWIETESLDDLRAQRKLGKDDFKEQRDAIQEEITKSKMRQTVAGKPTEQSVRTRLNREMRALIRKQALDAARIEARIANHPDSHQARIANQAPIPRDEHQQMMTNPDPNAVRQKLEENAALTDQKTDQDLTAEAAGRNGRNQAPVGDLMRPESVLGEERLTEDGRYATPVFIPGPAEGKPFFGPEYDRRRTELRQLGDGYFRLANRIHDFMVAMSDHYDPIESIFSPGQQATAFWQRAVAEVPWHVDKVENAINEVVKKMRRPGESAADVGRRILRPIDNLDEAERLRTLSELTPQEAAVTNMLHEYWKATKLPLVDDHFGKPVLEHYVNGYVPHIVLADPDGKPLYNKKGNTVANKFSDFARERITSSATGEPLHKALDSLIAAGYKVETDPAKVFREHSLNAFKAMQIRNLFGTLGRNIYHSPDGSFVGYPVIHQSLYSNARAMKSFKGIETMRHVTLGPGQSVFNMFWVHPEVADAIERFAAVNRWGDIGKGTATVLRGLADVFKIFQFSLNPAHAARVVSNIAVVGSKFGVEGPFNVWRMYNRANGAQAPSDRTLLRRVNPITRGREDFAINQVAKAEKALNDAKQRIAKLGFDPEKPIDPDHPNFSTLAPIYDNLNAAAEKLRMEGAHWDSVLHQRDQKLLSEYMGKGLVLPREVADASGQGWVGSLMERIPGMNTPVVAGIAKYNPVALFHHWMWKDVVWNGLAGLTLHMGDEHFKRAAKEFHGWDGNGGAATAESLLTPAERDAAMRQAVWDGKMATGILAKSDMSLAWQTWGRAVLLSAPWTLSQARVVRDATLGSGAIGRKLGRPDMTHVSDAMIKSGFDQNHAQFFDSLHTKIARRMLFGGMLKMAMTMAVAQPIISMMITGQPTNMLQNFQKDPTHTFDIWAGRDPATGKDYWISTGFFGWQRELAEYGLAAVKAAAEGKNPAEVATAPLVRFSNKNNPLARTALEMITGQEIGKWMNGFSPSGISQDTDIQAIHSALDAMGLPDAGPTEDKIIYLLRTMAPQPSFPSPVPIARDAANHEIKDTATGGPIPLKTDLRSILNQVFNPGQFDDPMKLAAYIMGSQATESNSLDVLAQQGQQNSQYNETHAQTMLRDKAMADLNRAFQAGDMQKVQQIRDANGLSDGQVTQAVEFGNSYNVNGSQVTTKGILSGVNSQTTDKPVTIGGHVLNPTEKTTYEKDLSNRQIYVDYLLSRNPDWISASPTERSTMLNNIKALAQKWTDREWDYKLNGNGTPISDGQFTQLMDEAIQGRQEVKMALYRSPSFNNSTIEERQKMIDSYSTFANNLAWSQMYGTDKDISPSRLPAIIMNSVDAEQQAKDYLGQTQFFQTASEAEQNRMLGEYSTFTQQSAINIANGKLKGVQPAALPYYVRSVINTEESAKYLLHQSDFYKLAPLSTQKSLDSKYQTLARTQALSAWQNGKANMSESQTAQAFEVGDDRAILAHLMSDQAFTDLQNQYGGPAKIKAYSDALSAIQKQVRTTTLAPPKTLNYLANQAKTIFLRQNPQYAAYLQARTNWERGSQLGQLYSALNADDQALAAVDTSSLENLTGVADPLGAVVDNSMTAITSPDTMALDTVTDPNSITPYVDTSSPGLDATSTSG